MVDDFRKPDVVTVAVTRVDGGLTVLRVVTTEYRPTTEEEKAAGLGERIANWTIDPTPNYINGIIAKHDWQGDQKPVSWKLVPNDILNENIDRSFRDAWKESNGKIDHDFDKVHKIHLARLREQRATMLENLDGEWMRAVGQGETDEAKAIEAERQKLRDFPQVVQPRLNSAKTMEEIKAINIK
jgi:hypothetical protein